jgi:uncharacterized membrane protein YebE (DUF533 family)
MFNPEKLLGGLIRSGMGRGRGMGALISGGAALGLAGVAMEAVEHFMNRSQSASPAGPGPQGGAPPPPPGGDAAGPPPAPPGAAAASPPPPPPGAVGAPTSSGQKAAQADAVLLIRAMIAAANADGVIDAQERANILDRLKSADLSGEERDFIVHELLSPQDLETITAAVTSPELARQVYLVSLMTIEVDTEAEQIYLDKLARRLGLSEADLTDINASMNR